MVLDEHASYVSPVDLMDASQPRKRPRPVVSCLRCREKKLKCDRSMPCQNCTKSGCPSDCMYNNQSPASQDVLPRAKRVHLGSEAVDQHADPRGESGRNAGVGLIEDLQLRLAKLEDLLSVKTPANLVSSRDGSVRGASPQSTGIAQPASPPPFQGTVVVKGTRTRYHGQNDRISLLNQFSEAKEFIEQCTKNSAVVGLAKEVQFLQSKSKSSLSSPESISDLESSPELLQLRICLPPKGVCDRLLELYTFSFEKILRVLHVPTFMRQYSEFWADPDNERHQSSGFLPQLTAVLAVALPLEDQSFKTEHPLSWEYLHMPAVNFVRLWLRKLGRKERTEIATLQVEALIALARRLRLVTPEELWRDTGALVRSAMVMGLHLDPTRFAELSAFQIEQRRRLWVTVVEMDLQASIASGMPVTIPEIDFGPLVPANLNDTDFDELAVELPPSKGLHEWTDSLAQITLAMSLPHRIRAMMLVRIVSSRMDLSEIVKQGRRLEECLQQVPSPLRLDQAPNSGDSPMMLLTRVLLDVYTRRPLLCLYRPIVIGEDRDDRAFSEIQQSCLESSLVVLSYQDYFDPSVADLDVFNSTSYWDVFQLCCKKDILWAALSVCGYMKLSTQQSTAFTPPPHPQPGSFPTPRAAAYTKASLTRIVENTLDGLTRRISEAGSNLKDVLLLAVVLQSARARGSGHMKEQWMQQGAMKALSACRQHLLLSTTDQSLALNQTDFAQMLQSMQPMLPFAESQFPPTSQPQPQLPDFLADSSALATEFSNFQGDPFIFDDESFAGYL
ncbi:hypothetical protein P168DRAFT_270105 [Aspergillus campestris IBT 28561]|uniref:Zn(2)-C6 fungal-type domain-containing protein n=1 Tax=Aspergillus campestris (strain IBT 28561) TaxID=1392248 RepID=A0A2I1D1D2_ASPC2|nr:uncharacterized protein P168DRAFT_270105 [Aspergillus campestris IBT 28561]PKY03675.1 hypothetical protein P168DRAFT_270105 [Aspergillus campestris IBT 28561]